MLAIWKGLRPMLAQEGLSRFRSWCPCFNSEELDCEARKVVLSVGSCVCPGAGVHGLSRHACGGFFLVLFGIQCSLKVQPPRSGLSCCGCRCRRAMLCAGAGGGFLLFEEITERRRSLGACSFADFGEQLVGDDALFTIQVPCCSTL